MQLARLGIIGGGTVGGGVYRALRRNGELMASRLGLGIKVVRVAVRDLRRKRRVRIPARLLTTDWKAVVSDPKIDVIAELMGGTTLAREVVLAALRSRKSVVTANKALLSAHGEELFKCAEENGVNIYYEASVAGGIPIIKVLREALAGNRITRIYGIINGTCNYILSRMQSEGAEFDGVLAAAMAEGYAEDPPDLDIDGWDALHKIGIMASLAHGFWVQPESIFLEGIRGLSRLDIEFANRVGYTIKLLGIVKKMPVEARRRNAESSPVQVSVYPALVPRDHVLAGINGVYNAILVRGDIVGDTLYYGAGAGQDATASAVLSDLADAALDLKFGSHKRVPSFVPHEAEGTVLGIDEIVSPYYLRLSVVDKPGTIARIAAVLGRARIGISSVFQPEVQEGESVPLILMIHDAPNATMRRALEKISRLDVVRDKPVMLRVENFD